MREKQTFTNALSNNQRFFNEEERQKIEEQPNIDRHRYCISRREYNRLKERKRKER